MHSTVLSSGARSFDSRQHSGPRCLYTPINKRADNSILIYCMLQFALWSNDGKIWGFHFIQLFSLRMLLLGQFIHNNVSYLSHLLCTQTV